MTTLDHTATVAELPSPGPSAPAAASTATAAASASSAASGPVREPAGRCSVTAVDSGAGGTARPDSVPRPRSSDDHTCDGGPGEPAGGAPGFVRLQPPGEPAQDRAVPVLRAAQEEPRAVPTRRPSPSRRLRRMHPETAPASRAGAGEAESASAVPGSPAVDRTPGTAGAVPGVVRGPAAGAGGTGGAGGAGGGGAASAGAETPLGILIGGTPHLPEEHRSTRVTAELIKVGRGTVLVVLPAWRPAIAVSVPTEQLLHATGLGFDRLAGSQLSVLINPDALHDRELDLHGWQAGPTGRPGRRGPRPLAP
ncbi:hypothetical protein RMN57_14680 [Kitasatospora sp. CM 4170]|uniref:Uncharacterized protein n=1 Tax=Kitasatospora aburaviensis TaxID=67265 RepID=A0ABW1ESZ3_9ACTN|nr:hypothetical protein [Kitasatospora sp. CM 4170]WNM45871.1 hypothetical protein RMN57_14680 [Kitasatospora sp. CM 4170]